MTIHKLDIREEGNRFKSAETILTELLTELKKINNEEKIALTYSANERQTQHIHLLQEEGKHLEDLGITGGGQANTFKEMISLLKNDERFACLQKKIIVLPFATSNWGCSDRPTFNRAGNMQAWRDTYYLWKQNESHRCYVLFAGDEVKIGGGYSRNWAPQTEVHEFLKNAVEQADVKIENFGIKPSLLDIHKFYRDDVDTIPDALLKPLMSCNERRDSLEEAKALLTYYTRWSNRFISCAWNGYRVKQAMGDPDNGDVRTLLEQLKREMGTMGTMGTLPRLIRLIEKFNPAGDETDNAKISNSPS